MPFVKGVSGNPSGKPKSDPRLIERCKGYTDEIINFWIAVVRDEKADLDARIKCSDKLMDRGHGRVAQSMELSGKEGGPLIAVIRDA